MEKRPNFFIVGVAKAGTTSLYNYLNEFPEIFMSPIKEPHYFSIKIVPKFYPHIKPIRNEKEYLHLFENAKNAKIIGESSVTYLSDPEAPNLIQSFSPKARILISLRDPVERAFSQYLMNHREDLAPPSFYDEITKSVKNGKKYHPYGLRLRVGLYTEDVKRYLNIFGRDKVKIVIFEEFINDPKKTIKEILTFLELNISDFLFDPKKHNPSEGINVYRSNSLKKLAKSKFSNKLGRFLQKPSIRDTVIKKFVTKKEKNPSMIEQEKKVLINYYKDDVINLRSLLGHDLPWSNFKEK